MRYAKSMTKRIETEEELSALPNRQGSCVTHCCGRHGCKYDKKDCVVETGVYYQKYACEYCRSVNSIKEEIASLIEERAWTQALEENSGIKVRNYDY